MGKVTGFLEIDRNDRRYEPAGDRVRHFREFMIPLGEEGTKKQAARCMDCGIPFCHTGCPVNNQIPDWNDLVYSGDWRGALQNLHIHQQFSRSHRPRLPGALRGVLHAEPDRAAGDHQDDRGGDRRPRFSGRLGRARAAAR